MRLSVVIPMYNEARHARENLSCLITALGQSLPAEEFEVIAVNDGSKDDTKEIVSAMLAEFSSLRLCSYEANKGKGGALREGMTAAKGDFVLFTDCDLAYGTEQILHFLKAFEEGRGEVILGSRALAQKGYEGYSLLRRLLSKGYLGLVKLIAGFRYSDSQCGIKGFERSAAHRLFGALETNGFAFDLEILLAVKEAGLSVYEMPVKIIRHGESTVHPARDAFKMFRDLLRIKKRRNNLKKGE